MKNEESLINVLLVEDEETLALIIKDTLEGQGFCIRLAKDGEEGLGRFFEEKPDVLVGRIRNGAPHPTTRQADTRAFPHRPLCHERCGGRLRIRRERLPEKAVRDAGTHRAHQSALRTGIPLSRLGKPTFRNGIRNRQIPLQRHDPTPFVPRKRNRTFPS